jgi:hypothetical protein
MRFKIRAEPSEGLCVGCCHGQVTEYDTGVETYCNNLMKPFRVHRPVRQCTDFEDRTQESEFEMRKIAWDISVDKKGQLGFHPPKKKDD